MAQHRGLLPKPWPNSKGGLAVVRPRRASSIRQTTLVSHGRVQDLGQDLLVLDMASKTLGWGHGKIPRATERAFPSTKILILAGVL